MDAGQHANPNRPSIVRTLFSLVIFVALILGFSWLLREFVVQPYEIPSASMEDTIMTGDKLFSEQVTYYFRDVEQGDIVTFYDPVIPGRVLIKRVIATAGQTVDIVDGVVLVDGEVLDEPYIDGAITEAFEETLVPISYPYTVPEGEIWVMGDNRSNSQDSRYFGSVSVGSVTGRAFFIYWPLDRLGLLE